MATEILHPQDILNRAAFPRRKPIHSRKSKPAVRSSCDDVAAGIPRSREVTILRRGESLDGRMKGKMMKNRIDIYAGSAFLSTSPPPSSLPLPSFPAKKVGVGADGDSATRDLRRLLRLE